MFLMIHICFPLIITENSSRFRFFASRRQRQLFGIHNLQLFHATLLQFLAHHLRQRTDAGLIDIRHLKRSGIQFVPGSHTADNGRTACFRLQHKRNFPRHRINGVHYVIKRCEIKLRLRLGQIEAPMGHHFRLRVDGQDPFLHCVHLVLPQCLVRRNDLPVQVGKTDHIIVYQFQMSHAAAGQCFRHIAPYAPDAEDADTGGCQFFHILFSQQPFRTGELVFHIIFLSRHFYEFFHFHKSSIEH